MKKQILLLLALLIMLVDLSSCAMRTVGGTPYHVWSPGRRTSKHWGARSHYNQRRALWGRHRYGKKTNEHRGRYR